MGGGGVTLRGCAYTSTPVPYQQRLFPRPTPSKIDWYEAVILLLLYVGYVVLMKYNERLRDWCQNKFKKDQGYKVPPDGNDGPAPLARPGDAGTGGTAGEPVWSGGTKKVDTRARIRILKGPRLPPLCFMGTVWLLFACGDLRCD